MATKICPKCGKEKNTRGFSVHVDACKGILLEKQPEVDEELQVAIGNSEQTPQERAKKVRHIFAGRGWPNDEHKRTVRDFMIEHDIPCI